MSSVYASIVEEAGNPLVIDSSKHPQYFAAMRPIVEPRLLHLVRDPRGVAYSWTVAKRDPDRAAGAMEVRRPEVIAAEWMLINASAARVISGASYGKRMRLEDVVDKGIEEVADSLSLNSAQPAQRGFLHTVAGNPLRHDGHLGELRQDERWRDSMSQSLRTRVSVLTFPLLRTMGYRGSRSE